MLGEDYDILVEVTLSYVANPRRTRRYVYGGLHCRDCFACWLDGRWLDVRLEYMNGWVLIHNGLFVPVRYGVSVRI